MQHAHQIARELNKSIKTEIDDGGLRLVTESTHLLWASLVHGVRNAIEHGIESEEERLARGKPPYGTLRFVMREQGQHLAVSVIDDGRGIDWELLKQRAYASRLPSSREGFGRVTVHRWAFDQDPNVIDFGAWDWSIGDPCHVPRPRWNLYRIRGSRRHRYGAILHD